MKTILLILLFSLSLLSCTTDNELERIHSTEYNQLGITYSNGDVKHYNHISNDTNTYNFTENVSLNISDEELIINDKTYNIEVYLDKTTKPNVIVVSFQSLDNTIIGEFIIIN